MAEAVPQDDVDEAQETQEILVELERRMKRLKDMKESVSLTDLFTFVKVELASNLYPLLKKVVVANDRRHTATEEQVVTMLEEAESILQYDDGMLLVSLLLCGKAVCEGFRDGKPVEEIAQLCEQYLSAVDDGVNLVQEITVGESDEGESDEPTPPETTPQENT